MFAHSSHHPQPQQSYQHLHLQQHQTQQQPPPQQQRQMGLGGGANKASTQPTRNTLRVREDGHGRVCIPGLSEVCCVVARQGGSVVLCVMWGHRH